MISGWLWGEMQSLLIKEERVWKSVLSQGSAVLEGDVLLVKVVRALYDEDPYLLSNDKLKTFM